MNTTQLIQKYAVPEFAKKGYTLSYSDSVCQVFRNKSQTVSISLVKSNRYPTELMNEYLSLAKELSNQRMPPVLTIKYGVVAMLQEMSIPIELLSFGQPIISAFFYRGKQDFLLNLDRITKQTFDDICPYLEELASQAILMSDAPYHLLLNNPQKRALHFAKKYNIPLSGDGEEIYCSIKNVFEKILPLKLEGRKNIFKAQNALIADFVAYCGETLINLHGGRWEVQEPFPQFRHIQRYGVTLSDIELDNDIMWYFIESWNFSPHIRSMGIYDQSFHSLFNT